MDLVQFLDKYQINPDCVDMKSVINDFMSEMKKGLNNEQSSLPMIPTYCSPDLNIEPNQTVIVLDAGGTNFRTCLVTFDENLHPTISDFKKTGMPGIGKPISEKDFFGAFADDVERLIDKSDRIGFCFSYAAEITPDHDGIPVFFSKEIKAPEVIGKKVGAGLLAELSRRGHDVSNKKVSVMNDTVTTLLAGKAVKDREFSSYIGFILGTGTNTAYIEKNENIKKLASINDGNQIINVESGCFDYSISSLDKEFVQSTELPKMYHFEKMISGAYLGPLSLLILKKAAEEGVFSSEFSKKILELKELNTAQMSNYLEMPNNQEYILCSLVKNEADAKNLYFLLDSFIKRAAKLTAANLCAAILSTDAGRDPRFPVCINADGTTFYKTERLNTYTEEFLRSYLVEKEQRFYHMVRIDNSPIMGAAIGALAI